jgi:hypothetical protein
VKILPFQVEIYIYKHLTHENSISDDSVVSQNKEDNPHQIILLSTTSSAEKGMLLP